MRLFVAIQLPDSVIEELKRLQSLLPPGRLSKPKEFHLTLKFLGDVDNPAPIIDSLKKIQFSQFTLSLFEFGAFPTMNNPRVIWTGLSPSVGLSNLKSQIDNALSEFKDDKPFHPHMTLARVKHLVKPLSRSEVKPLSFEANSFQLVQSILRPEGAVYEVLGDFSANIIK